MFSQAKRRRTIIRCIRSTLNLWRKRSNRIAPGWSFTIYEEEWNYGFHDEFAHFVDCVQHDRAPLVTGDDGRAVLEAIFAAYESARIGSKVALPFQTSAQKPIDLWRPN